jgi:hypothetical protein
VLAVNGDLTACDLPKTGLSSPCVYGNLSTTVSVALNFGSYAVLFSTGNLKNSAPSIVAGHDGICGPDTGKYGTPGDFEFAAPIVAAPIVAAPIVAAPAASAVWLSVDGARSCAVDAKFAQAVFANL